MMKLEKESGAIRCALKSTILCAKTRLLSRRQNQNALPVKIQIYLSYFIFKFDLLQQVLCTTFQPLRLVLDYTKTS